MIAYLFWMEPSTATGHLIVAVTYPLWQIIVIPATIVAVNSLKEMENMGTLPPSSYYGPRGKRSSYVLLIIMSLCALAMFTETIWFH